MEVAVQQTAYALRAEFVKMVEILPGSTTAKVRAGVGWPDGFIGSEIPMTDIPQARYVVETSPSVLVRNIGTDRRLKPSQFLLKLGIVSGISAVIRGKTGPFGELGVHSTRLRRFSRDDAVFIRSIANCLAEAIMARRAETELQTSLHALRRTAEDRRRLMHRLVSAVEEERKRIASDVHDDYLQVMAAVTLSLGVLARQVRDPVRKKMIGTLAQTVEAASNRLRELIFELRADALQDGLAIALRSYLTEAWRTGEMVWSVDDEHFTHDPPPDSRLVVYRICQEAISNARQHSGADRMTITLANVDDGVLTMVADDGVGFDPDPHQRPEPGHLGLVAMRERAELAGGWLRVKSARRKGSSVDFWIPLEAQPTRQKSSSKKRPARRR
ncbi:MAG: GAF domain-containing sensor histidine kinase [Candidatus Dormiibacterota bacterium]